MIVRDDYSEIVKRETGEPDWDTYEAYFEEVLEGRSIKSVVKGLRSTGYSVSETTVRARFKEWLAYKRAKEEFEIRLNQIKGEILSKIRETQEEIEEDVRERSLKTQEAFEKLINYVDMKLKEIKHQVNEKLNEVEEEQKIKYRNLEYETRMLKKSIVQILEGIENKGKLESLTDAIGKKLTEYVINYLTS